MKIVKWLDIKKYYEQETEKARQEMIKAIQEKDRVLNEISEQRTWVNQVSKTLNKKLKEKDEVIELLTSLNYTIKQKKQLFNKLSSKQLEHLNRIKGTIKELSTEKEILDSNIENLVITSTELEQKSNQAKELDRIILAKNKQINQLTTKINNEKEELKQKYKEIENKENKILEDYKKIEKLQKELNLKEKRLNELEQKLFTNKK